VAALVVVNEGVMSEQTYVVWLECDNNSVAGTLRAALDAEDGVEALIYWVKMDPNEDLLERSVELTWGSGVEVSKLAALVVSSLSMRGCESVGIGETRIALDPRSIGDAIAAHSRPVKSQATTAHFTNHGTQDRSALGGGADCTHAPRHGRWGQMVMAIRPKELLRRLGFGARTPK
jgi:hypothetical protein